MMRDLPATVLTRRAIVYVRQSSSVQVQENLESQRRQYELAELARTYGFRDVAVIDEDLGRSASGAIDRPGFRSLVGQICEGAVGARDNDRLHLHRPDGSIAHASERRTAATGVARVRRSKSLGSYRMPWHFS